MEVPGGGGPRRPGSAAEQVTGAAGQGLLSGTGILEAVLMEWWLGHWAWLSSLLRSGV